MKNSEAVAALKKMRELTKKRNFLQTVELMVNFTGLDMKKPQNQVNVKVILPNPTGKGSGKVALFAKSQEFVDAVKGKIDKVILDKEIEGMAKDRAKVGELMSYDALFAEGPVMLTVAKYLGQQLAPKGKLPKAVLNVANFEEALAKARTQVTVSNKKGKFMPVVHTVVGKEDMDDEKVADNIVVVYETIMAALPQKKQNIKNAYVKLTMGPSVKIGEN